jgi:hypothetical protein
VGSRKGGRIDPRRTRSNLDCNRDNLSRISELLCVCCISPTQHPCIFSWVANNKPHVSHTSPRRSRQSGTHTIPGHMVVRGSLGFGSPTKACLGPVANVERQGQRQSQATLLACLSGAPATSASYPQPIRERAKLFLLAYLDPRLTSRG